MKMDQERWRWAGVIAIVFVLMGAFAYRNPQVWQTPAPVQVAGLENPIPEPPEPALPAPTEQSGSPEAEPALEEALPALTSPEPEGPEDEIVAVSSPPAQWQHPGYGTWQRDYGYAKDPTYNDYRFHHGRDMAQDAGSPVFAAAGGQVKSAATDALWGGIVIIEHGGGWQSVYKCLEPQVKTGAAVSAGEQIGVLLPSPPAEKAQDSHVHFEMLLDGKSQNPQEWL